MRKNKEIKVGDVLKIPKKHQDVLDEIGFEINELEYLLEAISRKINRKRNNIWDTLHACYPKLSKFQSVYSHVYNTVTVQKELTEDEIVAVKKHRDLTKKIEESEGKKE